MGGKDVAGPKPYPEEFRHDVVRVARNPGPGVTVEQVATDFGVHPMTLWEGMRRADFDRSSFRVWCGSGWCWEALCRAVLMRVRSSRSAVGCWWRRLLLVPRLSRLEVRRSGANCRMGWPVGAGSSVLGCLAGGGCCGFLSPFFFFKRGVFVWACVVWGA